MSGDACVENSVFNYKALRKHRRSERAVIIMLKNNSEHHCQQGTCSWQTAPDRSLKLITPNRIH